MYRFPQSRHAIENRAVDLTTNMYLASAMHIAAALEGIAKKMKAPAPTEESLYDADPEKLRKAGVERIPTTLIEAVKALVADPMATEVLGPRILNGYVRYKQDEWRRFYSTVTEWERREYLRFY
jgi:glutamine synthetase